MTETVCAITSAVLAACCTALFLFFAYVHFKAWVLDGKRSFPILGAAMLYFSLSIVLLRLTVGNVGLAMNNDLYVMTQSVYVKPTLFAVLLIMQIVYLLGLLHNSRYVRVKKGLNTERRGGTT